MTEIYCPKCKSENIFTQKAKQPDGTMIDNIIKVQILGTSLHTEKSAPVKGFSIEYDSYMCQDCHIMFAIANLTPSGIIKEGGE